MIEMKEILLFATISACIFLTVTAKPCPEAKKVEKMSLRLGPLEDPEIETVLRQFNLDSIPLLIPPRMGNPEYGGRQDLREFKIIEKRVSDPSESTRK